MATSLAHEDLLAPYFPPSPTSWPPLTQEEVDNAFKGSKNTVPAADEIPLAANLLAWPRIGIQVKTYFSLCKSNGWHPLPFRSATLCPIERPGKRDRALSGSYRLISLPLILGNGLERNMARRFAHLAIEARILLMRYFGALPA